MDQLWEDMKTTEEKLDYLRRQLRLIAGEMASEQRRLNDRIVKLEQAHATFEERH